ncbi:MAG: hypothetical protein JXA30_06185 [Deltaproteobacteria bacterium]|nr:hypothetical protein [Deltaproteobacteria bacterium]
MALFFGFRKSAIVGISLLCVTHCNFLAERRTPTYQKEDGGASDRPGITDAVENESKDAFVAEENKTSEEDASDSKEKTIAECIEYIRNIECIAIEQCITSFCADYRCIKEIDEGSSCGYLGDSFICNADSECVECLDDSYCELAKPLCNDENTCVQCISSDNCKEPYLCNTTEGKCVECLDNSHCKLPKPLCNIRNSCVECITSYDCESPYACRDYECVKVTPKCGNGVLEIELDEQCDDGNTEDGDACDSTCHFRECIPAPRCAANLFECLCGDDMWCASNHQVDNPRYGCVPMCVEDDDCPTHTKCINFGCFIPCNEDFPESCPPGLTCRTITGNGLLDGIVRDYTACGL